ncbi:hypothetical protein SGRA_0978 [Saprospira grandis str. Lewin]|uniref:Uncharacterized protein n=1 Tax=Saprospira grandis (strain Lewin) TaxID=984262 RepID=H6L2Y7_SAPGL|nr:hypothetical protein SGRA_0978 [Saprospira grandis str. Lewin]
MHSLILQEVICDTTIYFFLQHKPKDREEMARTYSFYPLDAIFLGPAAFGGRALSGLAGLLGPAALRAWVWPAATPAGP